MQRRKCIHQPWPPPVVQLGSDLCSVVRLAHQLDCPRLLSKLDAYMSQTGKMALLWNRNLLRSWDPSQQIALCTAAVHIQRVPSPERPVLQWSRQL